MSEYQYYEFLAIDRPLTKKQIEEVRRWSTRAEISSTSFVNEYHWGNFKGDPDLLVSKYFDVMVYFANWGTHRLLMNAPLQDATELKRYETDFLTVHRKHDRVLIDFCPDSGDYDDGWDLEAAGLMASLAPVRAEIAGGDFRPLFLGWLASLYIGAEDNDGAVPPVPDGLEDLTPAQTRLAEYLRVDDDILAAAANHSAPPKAPTMSMEAWVASLPVNQKDDFIAAVLSGSDPAAVAFMRRRYQIESAPPRSDETTKKLTVSKLLSEARAIQQDRESQDRARKKRQAEQRAKKAAEERERRIEELMQDERPAWKSVELIVENKQATEYERAVKQLADLKEVAVRRGALEDFARRVRELREVHKGKRKFVSSLDAAKLL